MVLRVACDLLPFNDPPQRIASIRQKPKNQRPENQSNRLLEVLTRVTIFSPTISMKARDKNPTTPPVKLQGIRRNSDQRTSSTRYIGAFLEDLTETPSVVVAVLARQLGIEPPGGFAEYCAGRRRWDHAWRFARTKATATFPIR